MLWVFGQSLLALLSLTLGGIDSVRAEVPVFECPHAWPLRRALIAYDASSIQYSAALLDYLAKRFEFTDEINSYNIQQLKLRNPNFYALIRNSLSDNFVPPAAASLTQEYDWIFAHAADYGVDPEDMYLHFWTDTQVVLEGAVIFIPGWQPGSPQYGASATSRADARVPVYYKNLTRRVTNFATPQIRAVHRAYNLSLISQPIAGDKYWEGFFFDNSGNYALQVGVLTSGPYPNGGQLAEHPTHALMNSPAFQNWYWYQGIGLFMQQFREWIAGHPPQLGERQLKIMPNVYNLPYLTSPDWVEAYVDFHPGDTLFQEYEMNPVRDSARDYPAVIFQQNSRAHAAGIDLFQPGFSVTAQAPYAGSYSTAEALMSTVSLHWVTRTPNVLILGHQINTVMNADWQQNLRGIFDIDLGAPLGDPYVLATGTDGHSPGYNYTIYARKFACGLAVVRQRGASNEDMDASTQVVVPLPAAYIPVDADGNAYPETLQWILRNGQGQVFISATVATPPSINYQGLWWNSPAGSEPGWGVNVAHQGDTLFASWFTYDVNGKAWWLSMTANKNPDGSFSGTLYQTKGPAFGALPFDPTQVAHTQVGTGTLTFTSATTGTFTYTVNGVTQTKAIVLQAFGPVPTCVWGAQPDLTKATNFQDLWWAAPAGTESGWGVNLTQQGTAIFATWFTYDVSHNPLWYSVTATQTGPNTFTGTLFLNNGPAFSAVPFDPTKVQRTAVGTATFTFSDGNTGTFAYQVNDGANVATQAKAITRQVFRAPGTVCT